MGTFFLPYLSKGHRSRKAGLPRILWVRPRETPRAAGWPERERRSETPVPCGCWGDTEKLFPTRKAKGPTRFFFLTKTDEVNPTNCFWHADWMDKCGKLIPATEIEDESQTLRQKLQWTLPFPTWSWNSPVLPALPTDWWVSEDTQQLHFWMEGGRKTPTCPALRRHRVTPRPRRGATGPYFWVEDLTFWGESQVSTESQVLPHGTIPRI